MECISSLWKLFNVHWSSTDSWGVYACIDSVAFKLQKNPDKMYHHILQIAEEKIPKQN